MVTGLVTVNVNRKKAEIDEWYQFARNGNDGLAIDERLSGARPQRELTVKD